MRGEGNCFTPAFFVSSERNIRAFPPCVFRGGEVGGLSVWVLLFALGCFFSFWLAAAVLGKGWGRFAMPAGTVGRVFCGMAVGALSSG